MAKFSKAHYVALTNVFKEAFDELDEQEYYILSAFRGHLVTMLAADNQKFDRKRFLEASEPEVKR